MKPKFAVAIAMLAVIRIIVPSLTTNIAYSGPSVSNLNPAWSPDGENIVFVSDRSGQPELWIVRKDGSELVNLTNGAALGPKEKPQWSPDGRFIAFGVSQTINPFERDIWVIELDGKNAVNLTADLDGLASEPRWAPDGRLVFSNNVLTQDLLVDRGELWLVDLNSFAKSKITPDNGSFLLDSTWLSTSSLAFISGTEAKASTEIRQIKVLDIEKQIIIPSTATGFYSGLDSSINNGYILTSLDGDIVLINSVDWQAQNLTEGFDPHTDYPRFSPEGTHIAFLASDIDQGQPSQFIIDVWVMGIDGSNPVNLTSGNKLNSDPAWSPDSQQIAFVSNRSGRSDIWLMNADGSNPVNLTGE